MAKSFGGTGGTTARVSKTVVPVSSSTSADQDVDGLLSGVAWDQVTLKGVVTFGFPQSASAYGASISGFQGFNSDQQDAVRTILGTSTATNFGSVAQLTQLSFLELTGAGAKDALIRYAERKTSDAYASYPSDKADGGDAWFTNSSYYDSPKIGTEAYAGILHETGHTLGLKHSFENSGNGPVPASHDSLEYTVMSYSSYAGAKTWYGAENNGDYPQTFMMNDIAALQYMYGADFGTRSGDTVYTWKAASGAPDDGALATTDSRNGTETFDASGTSKIFMTVWDGGGTDMYNFASFSSGLVIDLRPGHWVETKDHSQTADLGATENVASAHFAAGMVANALGVPGTDSSGTAYALYSLIENAVGGSGGDTFIANEAVNTFWGNGAGDTFAWASLADAANSAFQAGTNTIYTVADRIADFTDGDRIDLTAIPNLDAAGLTYRAAPDGYYIEGDVGGQAGAEFAIHIATTFDVAAHWADHSAWLVV